MEEYIAGYSVVPNNNNKELVSEDDIQFISNNTIYDATYSGFVNGTKSIDGKGYARNTLSRVSTEDRATGQVYYFYRYPTDGGSNEIAMNTAPNGPWFSYESIVTSQKNNTDLNGFTSIFDYIDSINNPLLQREYYHALGRERYGIFKVDNQDFVTEHPTT